MTINKIEGKDKGSIMLYALSTCGWCRKTKELLKELGVAFSYIDVDLLSGEERTATTDEVKKWNSSCSFPTLVINGNDCIVGFKEDQIRDALK